MPHRTTLLVQATNGVLPNVLKFDPVTKKLSNVRDAIFDHGGTLQTKAPSDHCAILRKTHRPKHFWSEYSRIPNLKNKKPETVCKPTYVFTSHITQKEKISKKKDWFSTLFWANKPPSAQRWGPGGRKISPLKAPCTGCTRAWNECPWDPFAQRRVWWCLQWHGIYNMFEKKNTFANTLKLRSQILLGLVMSGWHRTRLCHASRLTEMW